MRANPDVAEQLLAEVSKLFPEFLRDPVDAQMCGGNAAFAVIDEQGLVRGRIFGNLTSVPPSC
jgi:hypothetical protein